MEDIWLIKVHFYIEKIEITFLLIQYMYMHVTFQISNVVLKI